MKYSDKVREEKDTIDMLVGEFYYWDLMYV